MKTLILLLFSTFLYGQTYNVVAYGVLNVTSKSKGVITITEKTVSFEFENQKAMTYDVVSNRNGIVYITDGVMVDYLQITDLKGIKKGIDYDQTIVLNFDSRKNMNTVFLYYIKKE